MSAHKSKKRRPRGQRVTSNVFAMFSQDEIHHFKEAFNMIDQNKDGYIDKEDLFDMLTSLGNDPTDAVLDEIVNDRHGPLNFTMFLTLFGEKLNGTDPEQVINNAFACFDGSDSGYIDEDYLREVMSSMGERWTQQMLDELLYKAPINDGKLNYKKFTRILKHGTANEEENTTARNTLLNSQSASSDKQNMSTPQEPVQSKPPQASLES